MSTGSRVVACLTCGAQRMIQIGEELGERCRVDVASPPADRARVCRRYQVPATWYRRHIWDPPPSVAPPTPLRGRRPFFGPSRAAVGSAAASATRPGPAGGWRCAAPARPRTGRRPARRSPAALSRSAVAVIRAVMLVERGGSRTGGRRARRSRPSAGSPGATRRTRRRTGSGARPTRDQLAASVGRRAEPTRPPWRARRRPRAPRCRARSMGGDEPVGGGAGDPRRRPGPGRRRRARAHRALRRRATSTTCGCRPTEIAAALTRPTRPSCGGALEAARDSIEAFHRAQLRGDHRYERDGIVVRGPPGPGRPGRAATCPAAGAPTRRRC